MKEFVILACVALVQPLAAQVSFRAPTDGDTEYLNTTVQVLVNCQNSSDVRHVDLFLDGVQLGRNTSEPYRWSWDTGSTAALHTLRAVAEYRSGTIAEELISVQVAGTAPPTPAPPPTAVTFVGVDLDVTDFQSGVDYGNAGFWFPQFDASSPRTDKPTDENDRNGLPVWAGPMTHMEIYEIWKFPQRTFSQDGPTRSAGGFSSWNTFTLPDGDTGLSGIVFDPHAADNTSQTVNRINLGPGTPSTFFLRIVVDNTDLRHNPINRIRARGEHGGVSIEPASFPSPGMAGFNGIADVYTFRYDGFVDGDFIKIQFNGMPGSTNNGGVGGSSFAGLLFDVPAQPGGSTAPVSSGSTAAPGSTAPGATPSPPAPPPGRRSSGSCALARTPGAGSGGLLLLLLLGGFALAARQAGSRVRRAAGARGA